jgi:hypothetical protein
MKTTAQVATELNLSTRRVIQAAQSLNIARFGLRAYMFTDADIELIRERVGKRGRPGTKFVATT